MCKGPGTEGRGSKAHLKSRKEASVAEAQIWSVCKMELRKLVGARHRGLWPSEGYGLSLLMVTGRRWRILAGKCHVEICIFFF